MEEKFYQIWLGMLFMIFYYIVLRVPSSSLALGSLLGTEPALKKKKSK